MLILKLFVQLFLTVLPKIRQFIFICHKSHNLIQNSKIVTINFILKFLFCSYGNIIVL